MNVEHVFLCLPPTTFHIPLILFMVDIITSEIFIFQSQMKRRISDSEHREIRFLPSFRCDVSCLLTPSPCTDEEEEDDVVIHCSVKEWEATAFLGMRLLTTINR